MLSELSATREGIVLRDHRIVIVIVMRLVELSHGCQVETSNQIESVVQWY